ncbi:hypothetical protein [Mitsuaria sp. GD03876]|uniref:hypothetical protein n=1 Tax=Mitsuaria sp. GD03876 TaxID=2975399 RepID=UPI0024485938|nr:hypothetical protein [Mitsuaria sp. GD03876]MDH0867640.1 hypothetical protein [Mitsuaria sp. GD03876]
MKSIGSLGSAPRRGLVWVMQAAMPLMAAAAAIALSLGASHAYAEPAIGPAAVPARPAVAPALVETTRSPSPSPSPSPFAVDFRGEPASPEARAMAVSAFDHADAQGRPFAVVDKKEAKLFVFFADGRLAGAAPALLGLARGDSVAPGVGAMVTSGIPPALRTTPAGRYDSQPGPNLKGETVIWVDYDAAFAIHRLRPSPARERRAERLASASPDDNRISLGCVVVAGEFFDRVVTPVLGHGAGVVYVLPEPAPAAVAQAAAAGRL